MKVYSFLNISMLVQGLELTGWPEGDDAIIADRITDSASHIIGIDGTMTVNLSLDLSGTIVFKLMQNSDSNALLTGLITAQENGLFVPVFVQAKNTQGGEFISGTKGYIPKPGPLQFGGKLQPVEWTIVVERLDLINLGAEAA